MRAPNFLTEFSNPLVVAASAGNGPCSTTLPPHLGETSYCIRPSTGRATRGCGTGGVCANAAPASVATTNAPQAVRHQMLKNALFIDDHAPGDAADRDRDRGLAGAHVDHRDVVTKAVGDVERALVARK